MMRCVFSTLTLLCLLLPVSSHAAGDEFAGYMAAFKNFVTCELTRNGAEDHFGGKPFKITMVNLHDVSQESGLTILRGAVQCSVEGKFHTLHLAMGVEKILDKDKVSYLVIRDEPFDILATELFIYPYEAACPWTRYWVDSN